MNLFQLGDFTLASGAKSNWKIECDALTDEDLLTLAVMVRDMVPPFGNVFGVPRGGKKLERYLLQYCRSSADGTILIVDDVLTSGGSMERMRQELSGSWIGREFIGAVVFARGPCPAWIKPMFQMGAITAQDNPCNAANKGE